MILDDFGWGYRGISLIKPFANKMELYFAKIIEMKEAFSSKPCLMTPFRVLL